MKDIITQRVREWTSPPYDIDTIQEINELIADNRIKELEERFLCRLEFGTGGLRGITGAGTNRMNIYTVGMATQGLANYILSCGLAEKGVVIARDSRHLSDTFAHEAARILSGNGITSYVFRDITPTPFASFAIREFGAAAGIVITASHNPPEYNGYKVYWEDGGQITPPHDRNIIDLVNSIESIDQIKKSGFDSSVRDGRIRIISDTITRAYSERLEQAAFKKKSESDVKIVYTPLHGTGYRIIPDLLRNFGFGATSVVPEQSVPDGDFPTVKSPNPEEKDAMEMAIRLASNINADIIMATDPDADRMGIGIRDSRGGYTLLNGNQIGAMLEYYILTRMREKGTLPDNPAVVKTIVTSDIQKRIADDFGCSIEDVLTGFKWIASKMKEYDETGSRRFVFGGEESFGYLPVDFVRDKDAVSACYFFAEMTDWLHSTGKTLQGFLDEIYLRYSLYLEDLHSMTLKGIEGSGKIRNIMDRFRQDPPSALCGIPVTRIIDYSLQTEKDPGTNETRPHTLLPKSNVMQFFMQDGSKVTLRPSGTEPKIKFYFSVNTGVKEETLESDRKAAAAKLEQVKREFLDMVATL